MSVHVLNTPQWSVSQVLTAAEDDCDAELICVVVKRKDGEWDSIIGGKVSTGDLLLAAEVLRRRAFKSMEGW